MSNTQLLITELERLTQASKEAKAKLDKFKEEIYDQATSEASIAEEGKLDSDIANGQYLQIQNKLNRTIDQKAVVRLFEEQAIPRPLLQRVFPSSYKLALAEYRYMVENEPEVAEIINQAVTSKPGKPTISIKQEKK